MRALNRRQFFDQVVKVGGFAALFSMLPTYKILEMIGGKPEHAALKLRDWDTQAEAATLPLNYVSTSVTVPTGADVSSGIAALSSNSGSGGGSSTGTDNTDATYIKNGGAKNILISATTAGAQQDHTMVWPITINTTTNPTVGMRVYRPGALAGLSVSWSSNAGASDWAKFDASITYPSVGSSTPRWSYFQWHRDEYTATSGSPSWLGNMRRIFVIGSASVTSNPPSSVYIDQLYYNGYQHPVIPWIFDGGSDTHYSTVYAAMNTRGLVGTIAFPTSVLDTTNFLTTAMVDEMYAAGWSVLHMSDVNTSLAGLTVDQVMARLATAEAVFRAKGWTRDIKHCVAPNTTGGVGGSVDANAMTALASRGYLSAVEYYSDGTNGSNAVNGMNIDPIYGISLAPYQVPAWMTVDPDTITEHQAHVNHAIKAGGTKILRTGGIGVGAGLITSANFTTLLEGTAGSAWKGIALWHHAGTLSCLPYRKWYGGLSGRIPRT